MALKIIHPARFQMPSHAWPTVNRIVRAYGAAQDQEDSNVDAVASLAGMHRPVVSANNNFLRSIGVLEIDRPKLTPLGLKLATGIGVENPSIITEALQEIIRTTAVLSKVLNVLRARGAMDVSAFRGQIILAVGLSEDLPAIKTLIDLFEESKLIEIHDDKVSLSIGASINDNGHVPNADTPLENNPPVDPNVKPPSVHKLDGGLVEMLLSKFPQFDPAWPDEVKLKWFDAFDRLLKGRGM